MSTTRESYLAIKKQSTAAAAVVPTHFLRYKEGDIELKQEIIANDPIQNNRWLALHSKKGKITSEGTYKMDLDVNEAPYFLYGGLGAISSADISSLTDASVYRHTITLSNTLPYFTVEQGKGSLTDTTNDRQNYTVQRAFGAMVDSFTIRGADSLLEFEVNLKSHGVFEQATMIQDADAGASVDIYLDTVEGLVNGETVTIYDETPQSESDAIAALDTAAKTIQIGTLGNSYTVANYGKVFLEPLTPSFSTAAREFTFNDCNWRFGANLTAAASASEVNIENWEFTYQNNLEERYGSLRSSPSVIAPKGGKAMVKFTKYFENKDDIRYFLDNRRRAIELIITDNVIVSATDTNNATYKIKLELSDVRFTAKEMPTGTDELYAYNIEAVCFYDTSDARAVRFIVENANAGTVYTA